MASGLRIVYHQSQKIGGKALLFWSVADGPHVLPVVGTLAFFEILAAAVDMIAYDN